MSILFILGRFYRKRTKNCKIWVILKVHAAAWPRGENGQCKTCENFKFEFLR